MNKLTFWCPFSLEGYLTQSRYRGGGRAVILPQSDFLDSPKRNLILSEEWMGEAGEGEERGTEIGM